MKTRTPLLLFLLALLFRESCCVDTDPKPIRNITVMGTVFCDACYTNSFTKQSYFLPGARVLVGCNLKSNLKPNEEISLTVDKITDRFGVYKLELPPIDGFDCTEGREPDSFCHATLISSSSPLCDVPSIKSSAEHVALKNTEINACLFNLNALTYRPAKRDATLCGTETKRNQMNNSLFFWPPFPPFGLPWPHWPPFQSPPSFPFPFPPIPFFTPPPSFPFPLPPLWPAPSPPPSLPFPFPPLPPVPSLFPSPPPPPSFPFPLPPFTPIPIPPLTPIPSLFPPPPPPPPPPPTPSFPFLPPLPDLFPTPNPPQAPSPPPAFSLTDPRTWFPYRPPSSPTGPHNHDP